MPSIRTTRFCAGKSSVWWLGVAVAIGMIGWIKSINLLLILGFVLIGLLFCQAWVARRMTRSVRLIPRAGATTFAGESASVAFELDNHSKHSATLEIAGPLGLRWFFPQLPPGSHVRASATVSLPQRGVHRLGAFAAVSGYPLGVVRHHRELAEVPEIVVLPALGQLREKAFRRWLAGAALGDHRRSRPALRRLPSEGDVRGIRPYRHGDNPSDVHWRTTARRGQLHVREYDAATPHDLAIIVEPYAPVAGETYEPLERALSLAATLAWTWANGETGGRVRIIILGGSGAAVLPSPCSPLHMRVLAEVSGVPEQGGLNLADLGLALRHSHRIFISSRPDSPWQGKLAAAGFPALLADVADPPEWYRHPSSQFPSA